ncbi:MAG TPA: hotdog domain-containing protein, partial [Thermoleophilaceae bacterium]|nr:hotdog domain-containing protein [Thermoleophilaceae bacterium]
QGRPGEAHDGVMASALQEAMAMALHSRGLQARTRRLEMTLLEPSPLGVFVRVDARVEEGGEDELAVTAVARSVGDDAHELARAHATFERL